VEIYFVLYLSAIILLLGTTHTRNSAHEDALEEAVMQLLAPDFRVGADRMVMIYRFLPDGAPRPAGLELRRDSINVIRAVGSVSDVHFALVTIEDTSTGSALPLDNAVLTRQDERTAIFSWRPRTFRENAVYRVTVRATATPLPPSSVVRPDVRAKIAEVLRRRGTISDSVTFTVNVFAASPILLQASTLADTGADSGANSRTGMLPTQQMTFAGATFSMTPAQPVLFKAPKGIWRNRLIVGGVTNAIQDLDVKVVRGNAQITQKSAGAIEIAGIAPSSGQQQIVIEATRKGDPRGLQATFTVNTAPLEGMRIPQNLWVGQIYTLDVSSSGVPNELIRTEVTENEHVVISKNDGGAVIRYRPSSLGNVTIVRYVGGDEVDRATASIVPLPPPSVTPRVEKEEGAVIVQTVSYGSVKGEPNRVRLKIQEGNADDPEEIPARYVFDASSQSHTQYWRVQKHGSGEFTFKAYALDRRGSNGGKSNTIDVIGNAK
jgi:hypothetical protein